MPLAAIIRPRGVHRRRWRVQDPQISALAPFEVMQQVALLFDRRIGTSIARCRGSNLERRPVATLATTITSRAIHRRRWSVGEPQGFALAAPERDLLDP